MHLLEWHRLRRLVTNAYRFGLESAGALAGLIGSSTLWGRRHSLVRPLEILEGWNPARLQALRLTRVPRRARDTEVEIWLDPARGFLPVRARLTTMTMRS